MIARSRWPGLRDAYVTAESVWRGRPRPRDVAAVKISEYRTHPSTLAAVPIQPITSILKAAGKSARPTRANRYSPPILNRTPARTFAPSAGYPTTS